MKNLVLGIFITTALSSYAQEKVVYGEDNRVDVFASKNSVFVELARSTSAMIPKTSVIMANNGEFSITGKSLLDRGMCKSERFFAQKTAANCSGFLVGEDLLVTAGHCIHDQESCDSNQWVFDYKVEFEEQYDFTVPKENVYNCKKIIKTVLDSGSKDDYALIQLDRKVLNRSPLQYRNVGKPKEDDNLVVIGHPTGLPTKIADGAKIRKLKENFFSANLDTYGGNSGSPVFNADTGIVEGILVRGETDYVYNLREGCYKTKFVSDNRGRGESVTYITNIKELL